MNQMRRGQSADVVNTVGAGEVRLPLMSATAVASCPVRWDVLNKSALENREVGLDTSIDDDASHGEILDEGEVGARDKVTYRTIARTEGPT